MKILLDMDGVLVNFEKGAALAHGREPFRLDQWPTPGKPIQTAMGIKSEEFWKPLHAIDFWRNLEWMPDGRAILNLINSCFGPENVCICSSPSWSPEAAAGKMYWIKEHLPEMFRHRRFMLSPAKHWSAAKNTVLIDDYTLNCNAFVEHGGHAVLVPRPWNANHNRLTLPCLVERFQNLLQLEEFSNPSLGVAYPTLMSEERDHINADQ